MDSLLSFTKPDYISTIFFNIEQRLEHSSRSSMGGSLADFLNDDGLWQTNQLHSPWGEWLYWWDAVNLMEDRLESQDIVRKIFAVEDILYYSHFIPYRGHKDELFNSADMHFSYEDYEEEVFYFGPAEDEKTIGYASSLASYLSMPPDDGIEENKDERKNNAASNDIPTDASEIHEPDGEKAEAQREAPETILEAIRLLFASNRKSFPQKLKLFDKSIGNFPVPDNN